MSICSICGFLNQEGSKFCQFCGEVLPKIEECWECHFCHNYNSNSSRFCIYCGMSNPLIRKADEVYNNKFMLLVELTGFTNVTESLGKKLSKLSKDPDDIRRDILVEFYYKFGKIRRNVTSMQLFHCATDTWLFLFDNFQDTISTAVEILTTIEKNKEYKFKPKIVIHYGTCKFYNKIPYSKTYIIMHYVLAKGETESFEIFITDIAYEQNERFKLLCDENSSKHIDYEGQKLRYYKINWRKV